MTTRLTYKDVRRTLDDVLRREGKKTTYARRFHAIVGEEYSDWDTCLYQHEGKPLCIVGVVLNDLKVPYSPRWETHGTLTVLPMIQEQSDIEFTRKATAFLDHAQDQQDNGATWEKAVKSAKRYVNKHFDQF